MKYAILFGALGLCGVVPPVLAQESGKEKEAAAEQSESPLPDVRRSALRASDLVVLPTMVGEDGRAAVLSGAAALLPTTKLWDAAVASESTDVWTYAQPVPVVTDEDGRFSLTNAAAGLFLAEDGEGFSVQQGADGAALAWLATTDDGRLLLPKSSTVWVMPNEVTKRAQVGINMSEVDDALATQLGIDRERSTLVVGVIDGWPAAKAGLRMYDVVTAVDGMTNAGVEQIKEAIRAKSEGDSVTLTLIRAGRPLTLDVGVKMVDVEGRWATAYQDAATQGLTETLYWSAVSGGTQGKDVTWDTVGVWDTRKLPDDEPTEASSSDSDQISDRLDRIEAMLAELIESKRK